MHRAHGSRRSVRATASVVALVAVWALVALAPPAHAQRSSCAAAGSRTVLNGATVRIFLSRTGKPYGCLRATNHRTALDRFVDPFYAPFDARIALVRLAGPVIGYTFVDPGVPVVHIRSVNLATSRYLRRATVQPAVDQDPLAASVTSIVVSRSGGLAWIQRLDTVVQVRRLDRRGARVLDSRPRIFTRSLRLAGGLLTWRRAGVLRRSTLL